MSGESSMAVARELGEKAFKNGIERNLLLDDRITKFLDGEYYLNRHELMKEWYIGWDLANLREPIEEKVPLNLKIDTYPNCFLIVGSAEKVGSIGHRLVITCSEDGANSTCILREEQARHLLAELTELYR